MMNIMTIRHKSRGEFKPNLQKEDTIRVTQVHNHNHNKITITNTIRVTQVIAKKRQCQLNVGALAVHIVVPLKKV